MVWSREIVINKDEHRNLLMGLFCFFFLWGADNFNQNFWLMFLNSMQCAWGETSVSHWVCAGWRWDCHYKTEIALFIYLQLVISMNSLNKKWLNGHEWCISSWLLLNSEWFVLDRDYHFLIFCVLYNGIFFSLPFLYIDVYFDREWGKANRGENKVRIVVTSIFWIGKVQLASVISILNHGLYLGLASIPGPVARIDSCVFLPIVLEEILSCFIY